MDKCHVNWDVDYGFYNSCRKKNDKCFAVHDAEPQSVQTQVEQQAYDAARDYISGQSVFFTQKQTKDE